MGHLPPMHPATKSIAPARPLAEQETSLIQANLLLNGQLWRTVALLPYTCYSDVYSPVIKLMFCGNLYELAPALVDLKNTQDADTLILILITLMYSCT